MKRKIFSTLFALVLALSLCMVMAVPAAADPITDGSIAVNPATATATAEYQVDFFAHTGVTDEVNCFVIEFPAGTAVPATIAVGNVDIYDITAASGAQVPDDVVVDGQIVRVYMPAGGPGIAAFHYGRVVFQIGASIENPPATGVESFCADIYTDEEPTPVTVCYDIYETVPVDVFLKYQIPPVDCGLTENVWVKDFLTIGESLEFVDDLYTSGVTAAFTVDGTVSTNDYGEWTGGGWAPDTGPIQDTLSADTITVSDAASETFTVNYNQGDGDPDSRILTIDSGGGTAWAGGQPADVVDVVSVTPGDPGASPGYQTTFNLTGDTWNSTAGDYGDWGLTTAGWTDGTSLGEALTIVVGTPPTPNPETYTVTYQSDDGSGDHHAALTILTNGNKIWSPAEAPPTNVVGITFVATDPAWLWYPECPTDGGLIGARVLVGDGTYSETITIGTPGVMVESVNGALATIIDASDLTPAGLPATIHGAAVMIAAEGVTFGGTNMGFTVKNAGVGIDAGGVGGASVDWCDSNSDGIADIVGVYVWPNLGAYTPQATAACDPDAWCRVSVIDNIIYNSTGCGIRADDAPTHQSVNGVSVYIGENAVYDNLFDGFHGDELTSGPTWLDPGYTYLVADPLATWGNTAIVGNEFYQNGGTGMGTWEIDGQFTNDTTAPNWIDAGILIGSTVDAQGENGETCYIVGNDIHDNVHAGICLNPNAAAGDLIVIQQNAIHDNDIFGIANKATTMAATPDPETPAVINVDCRHNDIYGNTHWGIKNFVLDYNFEAKENYWGALGGPSLGPEPYGHEDCQRSEALGNGDAISHWVYYNPWLSVSFVTVVGEGIRYYGSDTLTLQAGWNTLSVPLSLHTSANTLTEIQDDLGDFLTDDNYSGIIYEYDPVDAWVEPTTLVPGRGYYIKMVSASRFPVLYSNQLGLPAFELAAGWNLIGSAFGIDKSAVGDPLTDQGRWAVALPALSATDTEAEDEMGLGAALNSIGAQASVVASPSVPGQLVVWSIVYTSGNVTTFMYTGEGYWVFMTGTGTLAGFEITPFYFAPPTYPLP